MKNLIFSSITYFPRRKFRKAVGKKIKSIEDTLTTLRTEKKRSKSNGAQSLEEVHNTGIYMVLFNLDLTVLMQQLVLEKSPTIRQVHAKHSATLIYELFNDFPEVFGRKLREILSKLPSSAAHDQKFKKIGLELRQFRKSHQNEFKKIRNSIGAHRDLDGELQISTLEKIDETEMIALIAEINEWFNQVTGLLTEIIQDYSKSPLMIKEILKKFDQNESSSGICSDPS
jgi:hypothetical protein